MENTYISPFIHYSKSNQTNLPEVRLGSQDSNPRRLPTVSRTEPSAPA